MKHPPIHFLNFRLLVKKEVDASLVINKACQKIGTRYVATRRFVVLGQKYEETLVKITEICRACLSRTDPMHYLLENNEETNELLSKFASVANMEITLGFKYPSYLCTACKSKIENFYEFQQQCLKSNSLVHDYLALFEKQCLASNNKIQWNLNILEDISIQLSDHVKDLPSSQALENKGVHFSFNNETSDSNQTENDNKLEEDLNITLKDKETLGHDKKCVFCDVNVENRTELINHVSDIHSDLQVSWCSMCNGLFSSLDAHIKSTHKTNGSEDAKEHLPQAKNDSVIHIEVCKLCNKKLLTINEVQNHRCSKLYEKNTYLTNSSKQKCTTARTDSINTKTEQTVGEDSYIFKDNLKKCSSEITTRKKTVQRMRLRQCSTEDVEKAINIVREKFYTHVKCIFCSFIAVTSRSLSAHVTKIHRENKGKWCSSCNNLVENLTEHNKEMHLNDMKCPFCKKILAKMGHFMEHLASHSVDRLHKCFSCNMSFISLRHLRTHREKKHENEVFHRCYFCEQVFNKEKDLSHHLKRHKSNSENNKYLIEVVNSDNENKTLDRTSSVEKTADISSEPQNFCKICNKKVRSLPSHNLKLHSANKPIKLDKQNLCPHCGKRFQTRSKLTVHIRIHTGETPYKCQFCHKRVKSRNILVVHERTHTGEKPYKCTICGKCFAQSSVLNTHTRIHTGRPEKCSICEKRFCRPGALKLHLRKHTGEKPYVCDTCGQGFKQKSHLVEHTKTHNDYRPYKCEICAKAFKSSQTLKSHVQIHTGEKPFKCSQCSYACRQPYALTQHMLQHETDKPQPDYPHQCTTCRKNFATSAHLTAHHKRYHSDVKIESAEQNNQLLHSDQIISSDVQICYEESKNVENNYPVFNEHQIPASNHIETIETVENISTMIIQTDLNSGEIKFQPIIQITALQDL